MIARYILHGFLPYRDVYAVHPPLFYYTLALWMKLFGDSYLVGRSLSLFFGLLSVFAAYMVGRKAYGETAGLLFAAVLVFDPLLVLMNVRVYHLTMIEFFTLLSLYFLISYMQSQRYRDAFAALFLAAVGSSYKFTIIPFLLAEYLFILLYSIPSVREKLLGISEVVFTRKNVLVVFSLVLLFFTLILSFSLLYPNRVFLMFLILPGFHEIQYVNQRLLVILLMLLWLSLLMYAFNRRVIQPVLHVVRDVLLNLKTAVLLAVPVLLEKILVEFPLGFGASRNYIYQTYVSQHARYPPLVGMPNLFHKFLALFFSGYSQFSGYSFLPIAALMSAVVLLSLRGRILGSKWKLLGSFLVLLIFLYLVSPVFPSVRFFYPLFLVLYLYLSGVISEALGNGNPGKDVKVLVSMSLILLLIGAVGFTLNYPTGKIRGSFLPFSGKVREDLAGYIKESGVNGEFVSINPMDAYMLGLPTVPYTIDDFGLLYLDSWSAGRYIKYTMNHNAEGVIIDSWMFAIMKYKATKLSVEYSRVWCWALHNWTLLFSESYVNGASIHMFVFKGRPHVLSIASVNGTLGVYLNTTVILALKPENVSGIAFTRIEKLGGQYKVIQGSGGSSIAYLIKLNESSIVLMSSAPLKVLPPKAAVALVNGTSITNTTKMNVSKLSIYTKDLGVEIKGNIRIRNGDIILRGDVVIKPIKTQRC